MNRNLTLILLILAFTSCYMNDYKSERIKSPTGNFEIQPTANRTDKKAANYSNITLHLFDKNNNKITELNTGSGDANKWAIGWSESGDTIVLQSSDIGNKAWII